MSASSARHSTASAPCATCGSSTDGSSRSAIRSAKPSRSSAAAATTIASKPRGLLERGCAMLPRSSANVRSGRRSASWARRRTEPVRPARPSGSAASERPDERVARVGPLGDGAEHEPVGRSATGRSFAECTARSASPRSTASCTSFDEHAGAADARGSGRRLDGRRWSWTTTTSTGTPSSATTRSACSRASALPARRDAQRRPAGISRRSAARRAGRDEELGERVGVELAAAPCRRRPSGGRSARAAAC